MVILKTIRIGGIDYEVNSGENLIVNCKECQGLIDYFNSKISLSSSIEMGHEYKCQVLIHEIIHGILFHAGYEMDEELIDVLARGIYQVYKDNKEMFTDG